VLLLDREAASRNTRRFQTRLRAARLRHSQAAIEDVDYRTPRRLDRALFQQLATCRWIAEHRGLLISGPCGVGKSWLSCALAQKACRDGYTVHYARVPRLFADLDLAHGDGRFARLFRMLVKADLLVGTRSPLSQSAARSDGNRRGSPRPRFHPHHQPTAPGNLA
jgi:DNA replication protein DnaC